MDDKMENNPYIDPQIQQLSIIQRQLAEIQSGTRVKIVDFNMPFWALVGMMLKIALASIPAILVMSFVLLLGSLAFTFLTAIGIGSLLGQ